MRYLGIDFGTKRVGLALSDESGSMAFPHEVLQSSDTLVKEVAALCEREQVGEVVIGHSLDRSGNPNAIHAKVEEFIADLTLESGLPIHLVPEQYTTQAALRLQGRTEKTDAAAAALILDSYLTTHDH